MSQITQKYITYVIDFKCKEGFMLTFWNKAQFKVLGWILAMNSGGIRSRFFANKVILRKNAAPVGESAGPHPVSEVYPLGTCPVGTLHMLEDVD